MLGQMIGDKAVGLYSAATRISEVWYFIPMAIVATVFPAIIKAKKHSEVQYYARLQKLYDLVVVISVAAAIPILLFATPIINTLYGNSYNEAAYVLVLHIWAAPFVMLGIVSSQWFLCEGLQKQIIYRTLSGAIINILLNFLLIPFAGIYGAAIATLASQIFASIIFDMFSKHTVNIFKMKMSSLLIYGIVTRYYNVKN
jgi:O-antigen/teichoic acid export membrane protein